MSQARRVGQLPLRPPTPEKPRVPRLPRRRAKAPSLRTRHRTPRLEDPARVRTRVIPTLRSGWRKPIAKGHSTLQQSLQVPIGLSYLLPDPTRSVSAALPSGEHT